jgi:YHS domain-containing protein
MPLMTVTKVTLLTLVAFLVACRAPAAVAPVNADGGLAIEGYDPVAYFTAGAPTKGDAAFEATHDGATWRFASAENRDAFVKEPTRYAPQYGGYCAWAVSQGYTAAIDPSAWTIVDGKLYLNYNAKIQKRWEGNQASFITKADSNWPNLVAK